MVTATKNVTIVVLGDIGRSPRMQYHSLSLAKEGKVVDVIGYGETEPMDEIKKHPSIYYHYLLAPPQIPLSRYANYVVKTVWQALNLLFLLAFTRTPDIILTQNPPAIPSLLVCWFYAKIVRAKLIIDWHNYAHTIMALSVGENSGLVRVTKKIESLIGRRADANFCVTNAMRKDLQDNWNISAVTLYDRPPLIFKPISIAEKHRFLMALGKTYGHLLCSDGSTLFTEIKNGEPVLKDSRPGLIVSSTSWTEDEDFGVLFSALGEYERYCDDGNLNRLPDLICIITGKGHLKEYYCQKILQQNWKHVSVITPWLEPEHYPLALASADLGISLHTSSSGLDLPMKVVDMFGCGLPVCAYDFKCLNELVKHEKNSYRFSSSKELALQLQRWFTNFPNNDEQNEQAEKFKEELQEFQSLRWTENWSNVAARLFE